MKQQVLVIHGGSAFPTYEEYISYLQYKELSLEKLNFKDWKKNLASNLGENFTVVTPQMPNSQNARFAEWKIWFQKLVPYLQEGVILVGHSLGGIFLAKYLSENDLPIAIKAIFLVAAPYNTEHEHPLADFIIEKDLMGLIKQGGKIYIYHSLDDQIVPYSNALSYHEFLPEAKLVPFSDRGHFLQSDFPELVADIQTLGSIIN